MNMKATTIVPIVLMIAFSIWGLYLVLEVKQDLKEAEVDRLYRVDRCDEWCKHLDYNGYIIYYHASKYTTSECWCYSRRGTERIY